MLMTFLHVGLGGAIGSMLRFAVGMALVRQTGGGSFPMGVLPVNVIGSFLMGVVLIYTFQKDMAHLNPFLMAGILGGFTTFSAFSLEAFTLYERGDPGQAAIYVLASVGFSILGLVLGVWLARTVWA